AMRAAGMGPFKIAAPLLIGGIILSLLSYFVGELILPSSSNKLHYVEKILIEKGSDQEVATSAKWSRRDDLLFNFKDYDAIQGKISGVRMIELRENFRPLSLLEAESGKFFADSGLWLLENIVVSHFHSNG